MKIFVVSWHSESGDSGIVGYFTERPRKDALMRYFMEKFPDEFEYCERVETSSSTYYKDIDSGALNTVGYFTKVIGVLPENVEVISNIYWEIEALEKLDPLP